MNIKKTFLGIALLLITTCFAQSSATEINTKEGIRFITNTINYPITGTYLFKGAEPTVELNGNGTGFYQLHEQPKRAIIWGLECSKEGELRYTKGYDSAEYWLYYKYTSIVENEENEWNKVELSIHFNSMKMFINGERVKSYNTKTEK
jgi:hypothetical protein